MPSNQNSSLFIGVDLAFSDSLRRGDFRRARELLTTLSSFSEATGDYLTVCRAQIYSEEEQDVEAIAILGDAIEQGLDPHYLCRLTRADLLLEQQMFDMALADYDVVLAERNSLIAARYQPSARIYKAYILARLGRSDFESLARDIPPDYEAYIVDRIHNIASLRRIYNQAQWAATS